MDVTLTIDNGPYPDVTPGVLDTLSANDVKATFFTIGARLDDQRCFDVAQRAHDEGHIVANHTFRHDTLQGDHVSDEAAIEDIALAQERLDRMGATHRLFRPYAAMGQISDRLLRPATAKYLCENGYSCALWNSVPRDWEHPEDWDQIALADVQTRESSVIVVHDFPTGAMARLGAFIEGVRELGGRFTTSFPEICMPIRKGVADARIASLMRVT
ncbi:polysaccharide deacetylase family protein [Henriciella mobilis]|uniref:Chitooligosaccharide deacetylase n=1 Tax=Henriciella mobilis TaxID=2305467 RepID=A0A399RM34_9PROT|nr:polysaccharide deacetylase family protein [Henriciella mobilis]RIJ32736.1 polysaccharide deacetylase family protein [Henriciella mobilis]